MQNGSVRNFSDKPISLTNLDQLFYPENASLFVYIKHKGNQCQRQTAGKNDAHMSKWLIIAFSFIVPVQAMSKGERPCSKSENLKVNVVPGV